MDVWGAIEGAKFLRLVLVFEVQTSCSIFLRWCIRRGKGIPHCLLLRCLYGLPLVIPSISLTLPAV
jgi:hypothetical protein